MKGIHRDMDRTGRASLVGPGKGRFRILQVTDFHNDGGCVDAERTLTDVRALCGHTKPHLVVATGDLWCSDAEPERAAERRDRDLACFAGLGVPWALVWGNHDYAEDFGQALDVISETPHSLLPEDNTSGTFRVSIYAGEARVPSWDIFLVNTREQWHLPEDLAWFSEVSQHLAYIRGKVIPTVVFCHFPMRNYQAAIDEGRVHGIAEEEVLYWGDEDNIAAGMVKAPGNVRAVFCGHSHRNDCWFEEDGVVFAYGRATGHGGYGGETLRKGGKLVELDLKRPRLHFKTVFPDGTSWQG
jgi:hypothetical protein